MTAHQLAKKLIEGPDLIVCKCNDDDTHDEFSEVEVVTGTLFRDPEKHKGDILHRNIEHIIIY